MSSAKRKFTHEERHKFRTRLIQLCNQGTGKDDLVKVMNAEGFRKPNGDEIDIRFIHNQINQVKGPRGNGPAPLYVYNKPSVPAASNPTPDSTLRDKLQKVLEMDVTDETKLTTIRVLLMLDNN